jgi:hypothetical protein
MRRWGCHSAVAWAILALAGRGQETGRAAATPDPWGPWRKESRPAAEAYRLGAEPPRMIPLVTSAATVCFPDASAALPFTADLAAYALTEAEGVEISFRFRLGRVPPARLQASQTLAHFTLQGGGAARGFALHAYSGNSGLCLNGIKNGQPQQRILLLRGAADPQSAPRWDPQWHTVRLAWCRAQMAASWDGLPILHVTDPSIAYSALILEWLKPGPDFGTLELAPFEVRTARFSALGPTKEP